MLSAKPWKVEAVARLLLSVFICIFAGSVLASVLHYGSGGGKTSAKVFLPAAAVALGFLGAALVLLGKEWRLERFMVRLLLLAICLYAGMFLGGWAQQIGGAPAADNSVGRMIIATLSFQGAALGLTAGFVRQHQVGWAEAFGFSNQWRHALLLGLITASIFLPLGWVLQQGSAQLITHLSRFSIEPEEQQAVQALRIAFRRVDRIALGSVTILLAPVAEEVLFRGILYPWIKQAGFPRLALWTTSLAFAAMHLNLVIFLPLLVLALILTLLYEKTNNLLAPITAHALFNAMNFATLYLIDKQSG